MPYTEIDMYALRALAALVCACGEEKHSNHSLCVTCYYKLPYKLRKDLYKKIDDGYALAYTQAVNFLVDLGRIKAKKEPLPTMEDVCYMCGKEEFIATVYNGKHLCKTCAADAYTADMKAE